MDIQTSLPVHLPSTTLDGPALRRLQVKRLERLLRLRRDHETELNRQGLRLLDRAVFAAFCDCRASGAQEEARLLLQNARLEQKRPAARRRPAA